MAVHAPIQERSKTSKPFLTIFLVTFFFMSDWEDDVGSEFGGGDSLVEEEPIIEELTEQVDVLPVEEQVNTQRSYMTRRPINKPFPKIND
jgi:hypothetical protein